jgi:hypothetical protein
MKSQTFEITLKITGKLDPVPGWGNKIEDHLLYLKDLLEDCNYIGVFDKKGEFQSFKGSGAVKIVSTKVLGSDHQTQQIEKMMERHPESGIWQMKEEVI